MSGLLQGEGHTNLKAVPGENFMPQQLTFPIAKGGKRVKLYVFVLSNKETQKVNVQLLAK